jgi:predicted dehydrogenase
MSAAPTRIALVGSKFMGKAHSNAWRTVAEFFDVTPPAMEIAAARDPQTLERFARRWGWRRQTTDWRSAVTDADVDLVDIGTPNALHAEQSLAALEAGKHVACEKPLAGTIADARAMVEAAARAPEAHTFVWYNYRRVPAVALAHRMVRDGRIGRIYHVRAAYLQSWGGPSTPLLWRFKGRDAGSGAHGDLNAHIIDMARFITGDEIVEVAGAIEQRFIETRPLLEDPAKTGPSTVDDAVLFLARFAGGAVASFEATRLATGVKNSNRIEIHGERGALRFDFERMNELQFFDGAVAPWQQGWQTILATHADHPYAGAWWPDGHVLGYEHTFVNQAADILRVLAGEEPVVPMPDFTDAYVTQRVMEAAVRSARERTPIALSDIE